MNKKASDFEYQVYRDPRRLAQAITVFTCGFFLIGAAHADFDPFADLAAVPVPEYPVDGYDDSVEFNEIFQSADSWTPNSNFEVLFIGGFLSDSLLDHPKLEKIGRLIGLNTYYGEAKKLLAEKNVPFQVVDIQSEGTVARNAEIIAEAVLQTARKSGKKVLLVSHSKGGPDTLEALLSLREKNYLKLVGGWVSIQSPFYGTPIADKALESFCKKLLIFPLLRLLGGDREAIRDMSGEYRMNYIANQAREISDVLNRVPFLSVSSYIQNQPRKIDSLFEKTRNYMERKLGLQNDGMVPWKSAVLPTSTYVILPEVDHLESIMKLKKDRFRSKRLIESSLIYLHL